MKTSLDFDEKADCLPNCEVYNSIIKRLLLCFDSVVSILNFEQVFDFVLMKEAFFFSIFLCFVFIFWRSYTLLVLFLLKIYIRTMSNLCSL